MLKRLYIKNFRSIQEADIRFAESGLTVVIGANGAGKSNLIKCLEFYATIARDGLQAALYSQRSWEALLPKALGRAEIGSAAVRLESDVEMRPPLWYPAEMPPLSVHHALKLGSSNTRLAKIMSEELQFNAPLVTQHFQPSPSRATADRPVPPREFTDSWFKLSRLTPKTVTYESWPAMTGEYLTPFLQWLGMGFLAKSLDAGGATKTEKAVSGMMAQWLRQGPIRSEKASRERGYIDSWLSMYSRGPLSFCNQANIYKSVWAATKRYDFQLMELRREQDTRVESELSVDGAGLPSLIRQMRSASRHERKSWQRTANTLHAVAPHIFDASVSRLKSGKEFVEFVEAKTGRAVESWHQSDGTLRALAILLAVENHHLGAILIEEPEQGLHPWAIRTLIAHVRDVIAERQIQVIMTTHSQQLLDNVDPSEVIVASRFPKSGTEFHALQEVAPSGDVMAGEIGRLWVEGLLGGVPSEE